MKLLSGDHLVVLRKVMIPRTCNRALDDPELIVRLLRQWDSAPCRLENVMTLVKAYMFLKVIYSLTHTYRETNLGELRVDGRAKDFDPHRLDAPGMGQFN